MKNKNRGITLIELGIVIIIFGLLGMAAYDFFQNTFRVWWTTKDSVDVHGDSRTAINEISKYIRQASTNPINIGFTKDFIDFEISICLLFIR